MRPSQPSPPDSPLGSSFPADSYETEESRPVDHGSTTTIVSSDDGTITDNGAPLGRLRHFVERSISTMSARQALTSEKDIVAVKRPIYTLVQPRICLLRL